MNDKTFADCRAPGPVFGFRKPSTPFRSICGLNPCSVALDSVKRQAVYHSTFLEGMRLKCKGIAVPSQ